MQTQSHAVEGSTANGVPGVPVRSHQIKSIAIIGGFLDGTTIELTDGLNCIIGARGTGKTTILELVRYAMDATPSDAVARKRVEGLIEQNLHGGRIQVTVQTKDGLRYTVSRSAGDEPVVLDQDGNPTELRVQNGGLFSVDIFSQDQVESIADEAGSQLDLLDNFEADEIAAINQRIESLKADLHANASRIGPLQAKLGTINEELGALPGIEEQLKAFKEEGGDDSEAINLAHTQKALRDRERRAVVEVNDLLGEVHRAVEANTGRISQRAKSIFSQEMLQGPNGAWIERTRTDLQACAEEVDELLGQALRRITTEAQRLEERVGELDLAHKQQDLKFRELIEQHKEAQSKATERTRLERTRNGLLAKQREKKELIETLTGLEQERGKLLESLSEQRDQRFALRQQIIERINTALSPSIRVSISQFGSTDQYRELLSEALRGHRLQQNMVASKLVGAFWPVELAEVIKAKDAEALTDKAELSVEQAGKVLGALADAQVLCDLETVELEDLPRIELNDEGTYKQTSELSTGQKCTAILPILLLDSENPLLIDQPEDNLDNRFVFETIVESIGKVKQRRQLVFVTHNPNIPVLGDADKVFVLRSNGTSAEKACEGSVDECKNDIVTLLEGGEKAFMSRKKRYAY